MIVEINYNSHNVYVHRQKKDKKIYNESSFFFQIKKTLQNYKYDVIKKLMWKDGHLVDNSQYYIRERKGKFCIWYPDYAIRFVYEDYNKEGKVILQLVN